MSPYLAGSLGDLYLYSYYYTRRAAPYLILPHIPGLDFDTMFPDVRGMIGVVGNLPCGLQGVIVYPVS